MTEFDSKLYPFLKWAGGKRWLIKNHSNIFPNKFERYLEPFAGSAAVLFHLQPEKAILTDTNADLINTYSAIKNNWASVVELLLHHHKMHNKEYYYKIRASLPRNQFSKAARFIYLNRTCWNGLYRVNLKGKFNVPIGTKTNVILETDNFEQVSKLLQRVILKTQDFEKTIDLAKKGDCIFIDPPYTVKHNLNGFVKYNETIFSWDDQLRLSKSVLRASERGASIILTNANHQSIRDLYENIGEMRALERNSVIASDSSRRGKFKELLVRV